MVNLSAGLDLKTYMTLYTSIHNFCTAQKAVGVQTNLNSTQRGAHLLGEDLYRRLNDYLKLSRACTQRWSSTSTRRF
jgi:cullin 1